MAQAAAEHPALLPPRATTPYIPCRRWRRRARVWLVAPDVLDWPKVWDEWAARVRDVARPAAASDPADMPVAEGRGGDLVSAALEHGSRRRLADLGAQLPGRRRKRSSQHRHAPHAPHASDDSVAAGLVFSAAFDAPLTPFEHPRVTRLAEQLGVAEDSTLAAGRLVVDGGAGVDRRWRRTASSARARPRRRDPRARGAFFASDAAAAQCSEYEPLFAHAAQSYARHRRRNGDEGIEGSKSRRLR